MRYTPAGIPIVMAVLRHDSELVEAGVRRQIEFDLSAVAAGEIAGKFYRAGLGKKYWFTGFMARKSRHSKSLVFHITDFVAHEAVAISADIAE